MCHDVSPECGSNHQLFVGTSSGMSVWSAFKKPGRKREVRPLFYNII